MASGEKQKFGKRTYEEILKQVSHKPGRIFIALFSVVLLFVCVLLPVLGAPEVETDLSSDRYMKSDGVISDRNDALRSAIKAEDHRRNTGLRRRLSEEDHVFLAPKDVEDSGSGLNQSSARKLSSVPERSVATWKLELYYKAKKGSAFDSKVLDDVRAFEKKIVSLPSYRKVCVAQSRAVSDCRGLVSPTRFFYGSIYEEHPNEEEEIDDVEQNVKFYVLPDGKNDKKLPTQPIVQKMAEEQVWQGITGMQARNWYFDAEFPSSKIMRGHAWFGLPLRGFDNHLVDVDAQKEVYRDFVHNELLPVLEEASTDNVQILYAGPVVTDREVWLAVRRDTFFSIGSLLFVWLYMSFHLRTPILALLGMGVVALSFPMGLVFFRIFGYNQMAVINFLALFLLTGIGADNIFILTDLWRQAARKGVDTKEQLHQTMSKAGKAISVCGFTTAVSFLANSASAVKPVREFGIFVGTCVLCNLLLCLTLYPLILLLFERCDRCKRNDAISKGKEADEPSGMPEQEVSRENGYSRSECFLNNRFAPKLMRIRYCVIAFGVLFTIVSMLLTATSLKASDESPKFFGSGEHNLGDVFDMEKKFTNDTLWVAAMENVPLRVCQGCQFSDQDPGVVPVGCLFVGAMCNKPPCQTQGTALQCSGRGTCNEKTGSCSCPASWAGADCSAPRYTSRWSDCGDGNVECSGHGVCKAALCWCDLGWAGDQCKDRSSTQVGFKAPVLSSTPAPASVGGEDLPICVWGEWSVWSACSKTCGLGTQTRSRQPNVPDCQAVGGSATNERVCQLTDCSRDCIWGPWGTWSSCNADCGTGSQQRTRSIQQQPQGSGASCSGPPTETQKCSMPACQQDCGVSDWSPAGPCDTTCGAGTQLQKRVIANPGAGCPTTTQRTIPCDSNSACPATCSLGRWTDTGPCSATCGDGVVPQRRDIVGGSNCPTSDSIERLRNVKCTNVMCESASGPGPAPMPAPGPVPAPGPAPAPTPGPPPSTSSSKPPAKQPAAVKLPDSLVATVSVVFGLDPDEPIDRSKTIVDGTIGAPQHKDAFDFSDARVQLALFQLCNASKAMFKNKQLAVRRSMCFMSDFNLWLRGRGFKGIPIVPSSMSGDALSSFLSDTKGKKWATYAGFDYRDASRVRWFRATFLTDLPKKMPAVDAWKWAERWDTFIKEWNDGSFSDVPTGLRHAFHTSELWVRAETELRLVKSTFICAIISIVGALVAILFFTGNIALAIYLVSVVLCIVICLAGLMFGVFGWTFGVVEAIGLIVFVGFSVDYSLHIIEAYNQSGRSDRFARVREALMQAGSAVFSAGVTSFGAGTFICFCSIKVFVKFGMVVILNTCLSMLFSLCILCAALMVIGPTDNFGSLLAGYAWLRGYKQEDLKDDHAVSGQVLGPNNATSGTDGPGAPSGYQWRDYDENPELKKQKEKSTTATDASATPAVVLPAAQPRVGSPSGMVGLSGRIPPTAIPPTTIGSQDPAS